MTRPLDFRIISIGTLSAHPLWNEAGERRTGHTTCTLISHENTHVLVNPGLPGQAMLARLSERTPIKPTQITHIFLTALTVDHYRALPAFNDAQWLTYATERAAAMEGLQDQHDRAEDSDDASLVRTVEEHMSVINRIEPIEDPFVEGIDLFPLPGATPGTCGLLLPLSRSTVLLAGDAVPTMEHLERGQVLPNCANLEQAQESFKEAIEIADVLIPGRDNLVLNPLRNV
jgi:glyoxylase-like metal-dependent hydrolase (beta-lactamase superfamily II)